MTSQREFQDELDRRFPAGALVTAVREGDVPEGEDGVTLIASRLLVTHVDRDGRPSVLAVCPHEVKNYLFKWAEEKPYGGGVLVTGHDDREFFLFGDMPEGARRIALDQRGDQTKAFYEDGYVWGEVEA